MDEGVAAALRRARSQPAAFTDVYALMSPRILAFVMRRTGDADVAAELTAETFARAYEGRRRFRGSRDEEAAGWIYGIAQHLLSRYARRGVVERKVIERLGIELPAMTEDDYDRIVELAGFEELRERVAAAYTDLPARHHEALRLRIVDQRSYADVAAALGVSEQTARARVSRALARLATATNEVAR